MTKSLSVFLAVLLLVFESVWCQEFQYDVDGQKKFQIVDNVVKKIEDLIRNEKHSPEKQTQMSETFETSMSSHYPIQERLPKNEKKSVIGSKPSNARYSYARARFKFLEELEEAQGQKMKKLNQLEKEFSNILPSTINERQPFKRTWTSKRAPMHLLKNNSSETENGITLDNIPSPYPESTFETKTQNNYVNTNFETNDVTPVGKTRITPWVHWMVTKDPKKLYEQSTNAKPKRFQNIKEAFNFLMSEYITKYGENSQNVARLKKLQKELLDDNKEQPASQFAQNTHQDKIFSNNQFPDDKHHMEHHYSIETSRVPAVLQPNTSSPVNHVIHQSGYIVNPKYTNKNANNGGQIGITQYIKTKAGGQASNLNQLPNIGENGRNPSNFASHSYDGQNKEIKIVTNASLPETPIPVIRPTTSYSRKPSKNQRIISGLANEPKIPGLGNNLQHAVVNQPPASNVTQHVQLSGGYLLDRPQTNQAQNILQLNDINQKQAYQEKARLHQNVQGNGWQIDKPIIRQPLLSSIVSQLSNNSQKHAEKQLISDILYKLRNRTMKISPKTTLSHQNSEAKSFQNPPLANSLQYGQSINKTPRFIGQVNFTSGYKIGTPHYHTGTIDAKSPQNQLPPYHNSQLFDSSPNTLPKTVHSSKISGAIIPSLPQQYQTGKSPSVLETATTRIPQSNTSNQATHLSSTLNGYQGIKQANMTSDRKLAVALQNAQSLFLKKMKEILTEQVNGKISKEDYNTKHNYNKTKPEGNVISSSAYIMDESPTPSTEKSANSNTQSNSMSVPSTPPNPPMPVAPAYSAGPVTQQPNIGLSTTLGQTMTQSPPALSNFSPTQKLTPPNQLTYSEQQMAHEEEQIAQQQEKAFQVVQNGPSATVNGGNAALRTPQSFPIPNQVPPVRQYPFPNPGFRPPNIDDLNDYRGGVERYQLNHRLDRYENLDDEDDNEEDEDDNDGFDDDKKKSHIHKPNNRGKKTVQKRPLQKLTFNKKTSRNKKGPVYKKGRK